MAPRYHPKTCKVCGRTAEEAGGISATGLCLEHGINRLSENIYGLTTKSGPAWRRWRRAMAACVGGALLDEHPQER